MSASASNRKVVLYIVSVIIGAWLWMGSLRLGLRIGDALMVTALMWIPGLISVLFRVILKEGFDDVGWSLGKVRYWLWAYLGPLGLAFFTLAIALVLGRVTLVPNLASQTMVDAVFFKLSWMGPDASRSGLLMQRFLAVALIAIWPGFFCAFGEELGWRGWLLQRMRDAGWPFPAMLTGVTWGVWHLPLFVFTGYAHGRVALSVMMFVTLTALFGVFIGWLRVASGSVFVATMAHASFNAFVQSFFWPSFGRRDAWFWIGDYGILTLISYGALIGWLFWSGRTTVVLARPVLVENSEKGGALLDAERRRD